MIAHEGEGFLGYQAGSSTVRLFQDMLGILVQKVLGISLPEDFVFLRVPGDPAFKYENATDFLKEKGQNIPPTSWDTQPYVREHLISLNMNLYQSYNAPWDLTPRYYLENTTWTYANVREIIKPFFASLGIEGKSVDGLWSQALDLLPHDRGYIIQFFDNTWDYTFSKHHAYIAHSGGKPHPAYKNHQILTDPTASNFPQIRLVMANRSTLNPFSSLRMKRYDGMDSEERTRYESNLSSLIAKLSFDPEKVNKAKERLLDFWV